MDMLAVFTTAMTLFVFWLFVNAGISKLRPDNRSYYQQVFAGYGITRANPARVFIVLIGAIELLIGVLPLFPASRSLGFVCCLCVLTIYFATFAVQLWQGKRDIDCGCAGPGFNIKVSPALLLRNLVLIACIALAAQGEVIYLLHAWLIALPLAVMLIVIYLSADHLLANQYKLYLLKRSL